MSVFTLPAPAFSFAGFTFPKWIFTLPRGSKAQRLERMRRPFCGPYYHAPEPRKGTDGGVGFYLDSDGMPGLRWKWADEVVRLKHAGWFADEFGDQTIRGLVMRLPHGRGFLAGWSMGAGMASAVDCYVYPDEESAAWAADSIAENVAEDERDYRAEQEEGV